MFPIWFLLGFYALSAIALVWLIARIVRKNRNQLPAPRRPLPLAANKANVSASARGGMAATLPRLRPDQTPLARDEDYYFGAITPALASLLPETDARRDELRQELQTAGYYSPHALANLSAIRYALMMSLLLAAGVALILAPRELEPLILGAVIVGPILGWSLPRLHVKSRAAKRKSEIERAMPDLLDMLNMCVAQGLTVQDALKRILPDLDGVYPALAQELRIVMEQATLGNLHQALQNFDRRIDLPEVHSFTSLLMQTDRMGTSVSESLATYSDSMRESLKQRADEKGNRATFRLLFPTVFCLMPAVFLFLLGPAIVGMSDFITSGGRDGLDQGSRVIQRINAERAGSQQPN